MERFFLYTFLAILISPILAIPIVNNTTTSPPPHGPGSVFVPQPRGRGTIGLLWSCSATFIVCIWTSVHTDIPPLHATDLLRFKYKAVWMIISAVIPEGLIMCSYGQWREARRIQAVWKTTFEDKEAVLKERRTISLEEAFFVVMGGFTVSELSEHTTTEGAKKELPIYYTSTLTPHGFKTYVQQGRVDPHIFERRHISDKGKGSNIAKAIACIQVLWLVMECISRKVAGLPLTLLEIHVVIQVACTIATYALWWFKPLDVQQPILITILVKPDGQPRGDDGPTLTSGSSHNTSLNPPLPNTHGSHLSDLPPLTLAEAKAEYKKGLQAHISVWGANVDQHLFIIRKGPPQCLSTIAQACHDIVMYLDGSLSMMIIESILTIPIGGFHAVAWNTHFPSIIEGWMWRISSVGMSTFPAAIVFVAYWGSYQRILVALTLEMSFIPGRFKDIPRYLLEIAKRVKEAALRRGGYKHLLGMGICLLFIILYAASALFITVESYISVRSPPKGSFLTPIWSNYWPHI